MLTCCDCRNPLLYECDLRLVAHMNCVCFLYEAEHAPERSHGLWVAELLVRLPMLLLALAGTIPDQLAAAAFFQPLVVVSTRPMAPRAEPVPLSRQGDRSAQRFRVSDNQYIRHARDKLQAPAFRRLKPALACVMRKCEQLDPLCTIAEKHLQTQRLATNSIF